MIENYLTSQLPFSALVFSDPLIGLELFAILLTICYLIKITIFSSSNLSDDVAKNSKSINLRESAVCTSDFSTSVFEVGRLISLPKQAILKQKL